MSSEATGKGMVNNNYRISRRIGGGSFGEIYLGIGPTGDQVAVKFERYGAKCPQLRHEYKVYRELVGCHGFASVRHFGNQDNYTVMAMDLLGPSIEDLFNKTSRKFTLKTVLQIADQMLERIDTMHARHLIHRDIKPANFVIGASMVNGVDQTNTVYAVDFGLSKRYRHPKNLHHMPERPGRSLTGTPRYASINNHLGVEQSRRDDLESLAYVFIYLLNGSLPWQGLKAKNPQKKYRLILEKKQEISIQQLCAGIPREFGDILAYARGLAFDARPDIPRLRKLLRECYHNFNCHKQPGTWDWDGLELSLGDKPTAGDKDKDDAADPDLVEENYEPPLDPNAGTYDARPTTSGAVLGGAMGDGDAPRPGTAWFGGAPVIEGDEEEGVPSNHSNPQDGEVPHRRGAPLAAGDLPEPDAAGEMTSELNGMALAMARAREAGLVPADDAGGADGNNNGAVVAGARAMMRYRRQRSPVEAQSPGGPPPGVALYGSNPPLATNGAKPSTSAATGRFRAGGAVAAASSSERPSTSGNPAPSGGGANDNGGCQTGSRRGILNGESRNRGSTSRGGSRGGGTSGRRAGTAGAGAGSGGDYQAATAGDNMRPSASSGTRPTATGSGGDGGGAGAAGSGKTRSGGRFA